MPTLHPAFDPKTKTWFTDQHEAPTLSQLLKLLPRRTKIANYYPQGFAGPVRATGGLPTRALARESFNSVRSVSPKPAPAPKPKRTYSATAPYKTNHKKHDHEAVLALWVTGLSGPEIGKKLGLPLPTTAGGIVAVCRKLGDPRALSRSTNGSKIAAAFARKREMLK